MDQIAFWNIVTGPAGALVILVLLVASLVKWRLMVPGYLFETSEKRSNFLDEENAKLNAAVVELATKSAGLEGQVGYMEKELERLREELASLRKGIEKP